MDADGNPSTVVEVYRLALERTPAVWRTLRRPAARLIAGDVAANSASESGFTPHWSARQHICVHEAGHAIIAFLVVGQRSAVALVPGGGVCGKFDSAEAAREVWAKGKSDERRNRDTALAAPDRIDRLAKAIDRLFRRRWHRAALLELADRLHAEEFVNADEVTGFLQGWFPRTPAYLRALAAAPGPAPAPGSPGEGGDGAGATTGDVRPDRAGGTGAAGGSEGARQVPGGGPDEAAEGLSGKMDSDPDRPENLTITMKGKFNV